MLDQGFARAEVQQRYERYMRERHGEIDVPRLAETMFNAGERHAIQVMQEFSDILPRVSLIEERVAAIHRLLQANTGGAMSGGETLTVLYERKISDGNFGSEGLSVGVTMSLVPDEPVEEALNDGVTTRALVEKVRRAVLVELAASEAPRVAAVALAELNGKRPMPPRTEDNDDEIEVDLEALPF